MKFRPKSIMPWSVVTQTSAELANKMATATVAPSPTTPQSALSVEHVALIRTHSNLQVIQYLMHFPYF
jgi:hypothetical protein